MSLNRCEQHLYDHLETHRDEGHYWQQKVRVAVQSFSDVHEAARVLEQDLWAYYMERAHQPGAFSRNNPAPDLRRTSMRNLAEHLMRKWAPLPPKKVNPTVR